MKNLAKVPIGTAYKPKQNHVTPEGAMIQSVYLRSGVELRKKQVNLFALVCGVISFFILAAILSLVSP